MNKQYYIGQCQICKQGKLEVVKEISTKNIFICCDECEAEWTDAQDAISCVNGSRGKYGQIQSATYEDIAGKKWTEYIEK